MGPSPKQVRPLRFAVAVVVGLFAVVALAGQTRTQAEPARPPPIAEAAPADEASLSPPAKVDILSRGNHLTGFLFVPAHAAAARTPIIVYNHGSEQDPDLAFLGDIGRFYQSHGFAVLFPWRQGCSGSGGTFWHQRFPIVGDERDPSVVESRSIRALEDDLTDVLAAVDYARGLPLVDPSRVYVGGSSFGGLLALMAAAQASPAVKGAVVCSGAAWTFNGNTAVGQTKLDELAGGAKAPVFFMQARNDFNPDASEALGVAMTRAGLPHVTKLYPPFGTTQLQGHAAFCNRGSSVWGEDVLAFLRAG